MLTWPALPMVQGKSPVKRLGSKTTSILSRAGLCLNKSSFAGCLRTLTAALFRGTSEKTTVSRLSEFERVMLERAKHVIVGVCVRRLRHLEGDMLFVMRFDGQLLLISTYTGPTLKYQLRVLELSRLLEALSVDDISTKRLKRASFTSPSRHSPFCKYKSRLYEQ
jgi:hypothetical protein